MIAIPTANRQQFIDHAKNAGSLIKTLGATRIVNRWSNDVPGGKVADFRNAVRTKDDGTVVYSCIEWPDKATHGIATGRMRHLTKADSRFSPEEHPMPADGMPSYANGPCSVCNHLLLLLLRQALLEDGRNAGHFDGQAVYARIKSTYARIKSTYASLKATYACIKAVTGFTNFGAEPAEAADDGDCSKTHGPFQRRQIGRLLIDAVEFHSQGLSLVLRKSAFDELLAGCGLCHGS